MPDVHNPTLRLTCDTADYRRGFGSCLLDIEDSAELCCAFQTPSWKKLEEVHLLIYRAGG